MEVVATNTQIPEYPLIFRYLRYIILLISFYENAGRRHGRGATAMQCDPIPMPKQRPARRQKRAKKKHFPHGGYAPSHG